ncbi:14757_t:CDS:2 [Dentiscutata erythropus]|uniref:14757_t:CDS:1 n=1 Tax=Dentiscutata erythropus TaxID=1348616 RepID=A0A9N8W7W8_9GLOM|nr:14757_t:CDS:2 [Dentiscutata erythropus]
MSQENSYNQNANERTSLFELPRYVEKRLNEFNIENFVYSEFNNITKIGSGASAIVYSADYAGHKYALKSLNTNLSLGHREIRRFIRELKILNEVNHENIIKLYGVSKCSQTDNLICVPQQMKS